MESSSTFKRISSANRDIEKIPAPLRSHISSPNLSRSRQDGRQGKVLPLDDPRRSPRGAAKIKHLFIKRSYHLFVPYNKLENHPSCSFAYGQFNSNFTCSDPTILPYEFIHSQNRGTVGPNVRLPRAWQVLDGYASRLIKLTPPEYGALC
ncbi:hypothetical protein AVEN_63344-1 [Araneus ventricosus]|uniref:Uncharacterized protein n=1 Tax=Araneus ventricosus TaxID=182803 RepID=A0A4Y2QCW9_ARAVE|nr:hypothetical protein AVEN_63344-1 [Araneus ventricosus]